MIARSFGLQLGKASYVASSLRRAFGAPYLKNVIIYFIVVLVV